MEAGSRATRGTRRRETLARVDLFRSLAPEVIERLDTRCIWRRANAKEWILEYQDDGTDVFFLVSGVARVMIESVAGRETILSDLNAGEYFGELAAFDGQQRSAGVLAVTDLVIAKMSAPVFVETVTSNAGVSLQLLQTMSERFRSLVNRINEFTVLAIRERLCLELLRLSRADRENERQAIISPPPAHSELAGRISTRREAVTKEISALTREGLLSRHRGKLVILDVPRLIARIGEEK